MRNIASRITSLPRYAKLLILAALVFTPAVGVALGYLLGAIGFVLGLVNWGVVATLLFIYAAYKGRRLFGFADESKGLDDSDLFR